MNKRKVRSFKNHQQQLAKEIAKALEIENFFVDYEQIGIKSKNGKIRLNNKIIFPNKAVREGKKSRILVIMHFFVDSCDTKIVGKILKKQFSIVKVDDGIEIRSSVNPNSIESY